MRAFIAAGVVKLATGFSASWFRGDPKSGLAVSGMEHPWEMVESKFDEDSGYHYLPNEKVLLCICAKCGSTSLYQFVYKEVFGHPWNYTDSPWVHQLTSQRWQGKFEALEPEQVQTILSDDDAFSLAIKRDPKERLISVWQSKVACDGTGTWGIDKGDRVWFVPKLMRLAGKPEQDCLSFDDFVETLYTVHQKGLQAELDQHVRPQQDGCFRDFGPDMWFKVASISDSGAARELAIKLGDFNVSDFPTSHRSGSRELAISESAEWYLDNITKVEYEVLATR